MDIPSKVDVPRPISSRMSKLFFVAQRSSSDTSVISTMNVDCPADRSSLAPMRVKMRSTTPMWALCAGTNEPICAMSTISATCRIYVDLPAIFGPVMMLTRSSFAPMWVSLGTKNASPRIFSTTGWRPSWIWITPLSSTVGRQ